MTLSVVGAIDRCGQRAEARRLSDTVESDIHGVQCERQGIRVELNGLIEGDLHVDDSGMLGADEVGEAAVKNDASDLQRGAIHH